MFIDPELISYTYSSHEIADRVWTSRSVDKQCWHQHQCLEVVSRFQEQNQDNSRSHLWEVISATLCSLLLGGGSERFKSEMTHTGSYLEHLVMS